MNVIKNVVNYIFGNGQVRYTPRSGWHRLGIKDPENVTEHSFGVAHIAFVLAIMEGHKNPDHCAILGLFHDDLEWSFGDLSAVSKRYVKNVDVKLALYEQTVGLGKVGDGIRAVINEFEEKKTLGSKIADDADGLQMMFEARRLMLSGYPDAELFFLSAIKKLQTESAKKIAEELKTADPNGYWKELTSRPVHVFSETVGF